MRVWCVSVAKKRFFVRSELFVKEERRIDVRNTCWPGDNFIHVFGYDTVTCVADGCCACLRRCACASTCVLFRDTCLSAYGLMK